MTTRTRRTQRLALTAALLIVALAAVLRFEGLGRDSLWFDETASLNYAQWRLDHPRHWNNGMALFHTILHIWIRVAGESDAALRVPSAAFGVAAVALLIALVRRIHGWPAALAAGLMLALAWRHVYYSQEARGYSLFIMNAILSTLLLVRLLERPGTGRLVAYGVAIVALAYSHYQWVFVLAGHNAIVLLSRRRVGWGWLVLHVAVAAAYIPQIVLGIIPHTGWDPFYVPVRPGLGAALWPIQDAFGLPLHHVPSDPLPYALDVNVLCVYLMPLVILAGMAACAMPLVLRVVPGLRKPFPNLTRYTAPKAPDDKRFSPTWLPLAWFAAGFVVPWLIAQTGQPLFTWRYMAGNVPVYCWFIGVAAAALPRVWMRGLLVAVCVVLTVPALETMKQQPMREDWRGCAALIAANERPGDVIILCHDQIQRPFNHYYRGALPQVRLNRRLKTPADIGAALAWTTPPERVWLVVSHDPTPEPHIITYLEQRPDYRLVRTYDTEFRDILVMRFDRVRPNETPEAE